MSLNPGIGDAGTVPVRVQVIDMEPFALDLVVPTYLAVGDLSKRMAQDAGLGAFWEDGTRRTFWVRARGRVLQDHEKLQELGIVPHELLHLLPQPPAGSGVQERPPEYPPVHGYAGAGNLNVVGGLALLVGWTLGYALAISIDQRVWVTLLPATAQGLLSTSFARHLLGGQGSSLMVPGVGIAVFLPVFGTAVVTGAVLAGVPLASTAMIGAGGFLFGVVGVLLSWLAWYGAVEPLPKTTAAHTIAAAQAAVYQCGICGLDVQPEVRADCVYQCGRVFHAGCYAAKNAVHNQPGMCAVCGYRPGG